MTEPTPWIHDDEIARLPLQAARADLLEEIMATPVDRVTVRPRRRPAPAWLAVSAAAAAVAAIALAPSLRSAPADPPPDHLPALGSPSAAPSDVPEAGLRSVPGGRYFALDAPGWTLTYISEGHGTSDLNYEKGAAGTQYVELVQYPADAYDSYFVDRSDVGAPVATELLGKPSSTFTYSAHDHATMRPAENGTFLEVRGSGMDLATYHRLLDRLVQTDAPGLAASLPDDVVTPYNRDEAVARLLDGVALPDGFTAADVRIEGFNSAYQSAATVAGAVGCAWLDVYADGGPAARQRALAAFDGSRDWPLLEATVDRGDYAQVFWGVAGQLRAGEPAASLRGGIC